MYAVPFRALNLIDRVVVDSLFAVFHVLRHVRSVLAVKKRDKIEVYSDLITSIAQTTSIQGKLKLTKSCEICKFNADIYDDIKWHGIVGTEYSLTSAFVSFP